MRGLRLSCSIGLEFTKIYAAKGWDVIAAVRDPSSFPAVEGSIRTVKIDAASTTDAAEVSLSVSAVQSLD